MRLPRRSTPRPLLEGAGEFVANRSVGWTSATSFSFSFAEDSETERSWLRFDATSPGFVAGDGRVRRGTSGRMMGAVQNADPRCTRTPVVGSGAAAWQPDNHGGRQ